MIKINLLGDDTGIDNSWKFFLAGYVLSVVVCLFFFFSLYTDITNEVTDKTRRVEDQTRRLNNLKEKTREVRELEKKKKTLHDKLALIARLKKSKIGPVRVMDDLNVAVPSQVWLRRIEEKGDVMRIKGRSLTNDDIARFLGNLEQSDYFDKVELEKSVQMYYSKRTGKVSPTPDVTSLRRGSPDFSTENRATKESPLKGGANKGQRWAIKRTGKGKRNRKKQIDDFNVKIKEFVVTAHVNYTGKVRLAALKVEKALEEKTAAKSRTRKQP